MHEIMILSIAGSTSVQLGVVAVISVVFHSPPDTPTANTVLFVESLGSIRMALVLPPMVLGPISVHSE